MINIWEDLTEPYEFEKRYFVWREKTTKELSEKVWKEYLKQKNMSLVDIKREIKEAVKGGFLNPPKEYIEKIDAQDSFTFFQKYVDAWYQHDLFTFTNSGNILPNPQMDPSFLVTFLENDKDIMAYTLCIPKKVEKLGEVLIKISKNPDTVYCPVRVFEHDLSDVCRQTDLTFAELSNLFYSDYDKVNSLLLLNKNRLSLQQNASMQPIKDFLMEDYNHTPELRLFFRMNFWSNYDEWRRRFFIEFGIIDYLYRKKLFEEYKERLPKERKTFLNMVPEDILLNKLQLK